jgi:electron transport complex protein RnfB
MTDEIYRKLQEHLDGLPVGFPKTESGIEIDILKKIFEPEEAEMAVLLSIMPETVNDFCQRTGLAAEKAEEMLARMASKGQIFRIRRGEKNYYSASIFVPGIWEYQLNNLDRELAELFEKFYDEAIGKTLAHIKTPLFRVIPVGENISPEMRVMPYNQVEELIRSQRTIAVAECICRRERRLVGEGCEHLDEVCLAFSHVARYYVENGLARFISTEEAIDVLDRAEKDGLVHSPVNTQRIMGLCNCCGCCCGLLRGITQLGLPASRIVRSDFFCVCDPEVCSGCGDCLDRCQVNAIAIEDDIARINREGCIGCGLCVSTCPTGALELVQKSPDETETPPPNSSIEMLMRLAEEKGEKQD